MSVVFASLGGVGLLASLIVRWTDVLVLWPTDQTRRYYAGYELYERLGAPGALLTLTVVVTALGAICASANGNANLTLRFGVLASVAVGLSCLALVVVAPLESTIGRGSIGFEPKLEFGALLALVSAVLALTGGLVARREHSNFRRRQ